MSLPVPWPGLLALVDRASAFAPEPYGVAIAEGSGTARSSVCALLGRGDAIDADNYTELVERGWINAHRRVGNRVGVWWQLTAGDGAAQARAFADAIRSIEHELDVAPGTLFAMVEDENQGMDLLAPAFAGKFRELLPIRQAAVVPLGLGFKGGDGVWYPAATNLRAWRAHDFRDYPECYAGNMLRADTYGTLRAHRLYFPASYIRPLLNAPLLDESAIIAELDAVVHARADNSAWKGVAAFPGERLSPSNWRRLGAGALSRGLIS